MCPINQLVITVGGFALVYLVAVWLLVWVSGRNPKRSTNGEPRA